MSFDGYLKALPAERRAVVQSLVDLVRKNIPKGYAKTMAAGYPSWVVPLATFPDTYNGQPLCYVAIAAQKNHYAVYLMGVYGSAALRRKLAAAFAKAGKRLDMGKSCLRFKKPEDVPLPAIGRIVAAVPLRTYLAAYQKARA
jgi:hypothetical protein